MEPDFGPPVAAVPQFGPILVCRQTNSTSMAIFFPSACKDQLPTMTWDRLGKTPWHSAKSGSRSKKHRGPVAPPAPLWFHWEGLCSHSSRIASLLQTADTLLGSTCLPCAEQDQDLPLQNIQNPLPLQPKLIFPAISDQRPVDKV